MYAFIAMGYFWTNKLLCYLKNAFNFNFGTDTVSIGPHSSPYSFDSSPDLLAKLTGVSLDGVVSLFHNLASQVSNPSSHQGNWHRIIYETNTQLDFYCV